MSHNRQSNLYAGKSARRGGVYLINYESMVAKISKWTFLFVFVLLPLHGVLSQEYKNLYFHKANKILYDLEGKALWADSLGYITLEGDIIAASDLLPVYFDKGKNGFSNYIDSCYYNSPMYNHDEFHFWITIHIIFNDDRNIEEVRMVGPCSSRITPKLRSYLVDCVLKTNGHWIFKRKDHGKYAYVETCKF